MEDVFDVDRILFPTDFSTNSEAAARYISGFAKAIGASVSLLHVVPSLTEWCGASERYYADLAPASYRLMLDTHKLAESAGIRGLENLKQSYFNGVCTQLLVRTGGVAGTIVDCANEIDADLITMTTHGWGPQRRFLIGSAAAKVLHDTDRPVWTTPHVCELGEYRPYRQIVCATDYRMLSEDLLLRVQGVVKRFGGRLIVVSAVPSPAGHYGPGSAQDPMHSIRKETEALLKKSLADLNIEAEVDVLDGSVGEVVRRCAVFELADLIVIGHGHLGEQMGHLRTHAYEIIWNAPCPVLTM